MIDETEQMPREDWLPQDGWQRRYGPEGKGSTYYPMLTQFIRDRGITSVVEIGVRTGYSMAAMLRGNPWLTYLGIEDDRGTSGGRRGGLMHAEVLRQRYAQGEARFWVINSHKVPTLPQRFDLAYIDGDHTYQGCLQDLDLVKPYVRFILVDDYDYIATVRLAVDAFAARERYAITYIPSHRGWALMDVPHDSD